MQVWTETEKTGISVFNYVNNRNSKIRFLCLKHDLLTSKKIENSIKQIQEIKSDK